MFRRLIGASAAALTLLASAAHAEDIIVPLDMAAAIRLPGAAEGIAIGNPSIAGVSVQNDTLLFVTGRSYGTTNLVIIGQGGRTLYNGRVTVTPDERGTVTVTRGTESARLTCAVVCRPQPDIGDSSDAFSRTTEQINGRTSTAEGAQ